MKKSVFTFGLLASLLVMLAVMPFLNNNSFSNTAMAQGYDAGYGDSSSYSNTRLRIINMSVEQVHLRDSL
jgi:hypothetical protein